MKVLLASPIDPGTTESLRARYDVVEAGPGELRESVRDAEIVVLRSGPVLSEDVMAEAAGLRAVVRAGYGLDNIDVDYARSRGVRVVRIAGMSGPPVAEMTFALLLSLARNVTLADRLIRAGDWPNDTTYDIASEQPGNVETITVNSPASGWNFIMLKPKTASFDGVEVSAEWQ